MSSPVFINAAGIATPATGDQRQQILSLLSGAPLFERHPTWIGTDGQRQIMAFVPELRDVSDFSTRLAMLLHNAFSDCKRDQYARMGRITQAPMILVLPSLLRQPAFTNAFRAAASEMDFSGVTEVRFNFGGAASGMPLLLQGSSSPIYLAAVDSLVTPFLLDFLAAQGLSRDRHHPWNAIPSEASACLLLSPQPGISRVVTCGLSHEPQRLSDAGRGLLGQGLCRAIDAAMEDSDGSNVRDILTDANSERWRAEELGVVQSERPDLNTDDIKWHYTTRSAGDFGSATGLISIAIACARASTSLILSSDRSGKRAAVIMQPTST